MTHGGPGQPEPREGAKALTDDLRSFAGAFPDLRTEAELLIGQGEWVCATASLTGTHTGPLALDDVTTIPPTGKRIDLRHAIFFKVVDGKIAEHRDYFDTMQLMSQLGISSAA
jgi:predicted ester cyclase